MHWSKLSDEYDKQQMHCLKLSFMFAWYCLQGDKQRFAQQHEALMQMGHKTHGSKHEYYKQMIMREAAWDDVHPVL